MTVHDIAADQLKCVRALSVILADGTLPMPQTWGIHTYPGYDPPIAPELEGLFLDTLTPSVSELRGQLGVYADRLGLVLTVKPHGGAGMVGVHANGTWRGVEVHVWGPATAPVADVSDETPAEVIAAAKDAYTKHDARLLDEDQPLAARGHGQDVATQYAHAMTGSGAETPRCGAAGKVALFAYSVTCPRCVALLDEQTVDGYRTEAQRAELHLDLTDEALSALAVQCSRQAVTR